MARIVGVLDQPLARVAERSHDGRQVAAVDEVVQHCRSRGVAEVVAAVEHDHHRVRGFRLVGEARRQIHACSRRAGQRPALAHPLDEPSRRHCFVVLRPRGLLVAVSRGHRVHAERVCCFIAVEWVGNQVCAEAVDDLQLVLDSRSGRDGKGQDPPVGVAELLEGEVVCEADAEVHQADADDLAVMGERARLPIDDRERLTAVATLLEVLWRDRRRHADPHDGGRLDGRHEAWTWMVRPTSSSMPRSTS